MRIIFAIFAVLGLALAGFPVAAAPPDKVPPGKQGVTAEEAVGAVFSEIEKRLIRDYFGTHPELGGNDGGKGKSKEMPRGLAKRETLPPGLEMQIQRNGTLPPGLAKRDLPSDLERRLSALPKGRIRKIVGNDVVLIEEATGLVLDVLEGVLKSK